VSLWRDPDDVPYCRILSADKIEWRLISATLCGWRQCFVADQLWFMTHIREEEEDWSHCRVTVWFVLGSLTKYQDTYDWQSQWLPWSKIKVISSHHLYVFSLPLLNSRNKVLYLCHQRPAGAYSVGWTQQSHFLLSLRLAHSLVQKWVVVE